MPLNEIPQVRENLRLSQIPPAPRISLQIFRILRKSIHKALRVTQGAGIDVREPCSADVGKGVDQFNGESEIAQGVGLTNSAKARADD